MNRSAATASALMVFFGFISTSCATGKATKYRAPAEDYAYRVRGTDRTGRITRAYQAELFSRTKTWAWPLKTLSVNSAFGNRKGDFHDGLDLKAASGTPVFAVSDGKVIYSDNRIAGYGRMVVLKHAGELSTIYAHNEKLVVKKGSEVKKGDLIAYTGSSGRSSGPHLHFEVRVGVKAINPLYVLPKRGYEAISDRMLAARSNPAKPIATKPTATRPITVASASGRPTNVRSAATDTMTAPTSAASAARSRSGAKSGKLAGKNGVSGVAIASTGSNAGTSARTPANIHARVVANRLSQSAAVRPRVARRYRVDSVARKDLPTRRIVRENTIVSAAPTANDSADSDSDPASASIER